MMLEDGAADTFRNDSQVVLQTLLASSLVLAVIFLILGINFGEFRSNELEQDYEWWEAVSYTQLTLPTILRV